MSCICLENIILSPFRAFGDYLAKKENMRQRIYRQRQLERNLAKRRGQMEWERLQAIMEENKQNEWIVIDEEI